MRDPREGVAADGTITTGTITTGAARSRVAPVFEPVLTAVVDRLAGWPTASVHLYGSVATGTAAVGRSDVDLLTVDLPTDVATEVGTELSRRFATICRGVEIAPAGSTDLVADNDAGYGLRVFLRHYCVHLSGPVVGRGGREVGAHLRRWRERLVTDDAAALGRRVARKSLLAVAGLVSLAEHTWTTDRDLAAQLYRRRRPERGDALGTLARWAADEAVPTSHDVAAVLRPGELIEQLVEDFAASAGLWPEAADDS